jgi:ureidoglycolate lyase
MNITAVAASEVDFTRFGEIILLGKEGSGTLESHGDGWRDVCTEQPLLRAPAQLGMTTGSAAPFATRALERHLYTEEAIMPMAAPVILPLAAPTAAEAPAAVDIVAVILEPGQVAVLHPGTWHDACHGIDGPVRYYWMATPIAGEESDWVEVAGGPVRVSC